LNRGVGVAVRWGVIAMMVIQFGAVMLRYVFGMSYIFVNETVLYLHAALFMLGAGYTLWRDAHVRVDVLYARLGPRARAAVNLFGTVVFLVPTCVVILVYTWDYVAKAWAIREGAISVGGIPASYLLKSLIPAFAVLLLVQGVSLALKSAVELAQGRRVAPTGRPEGI